MLLNNIKIIPTIVARNLILRDTLEGEGESQYHNFFYDFERNFSSN